ncbi:MAG: hypothetical protein ACRDGI_04050 [Candidatus Limnocylindrales bacterium]
MATAMNARNLPVRRSLATPHVRDLVARALHDVAVLSLEFGPHDLPAAADREWIRGAIAIPIQEATEAALSVFDRAVWQALAQAPDRLLERYGESHLLDDLGLD